MTTAARKRRKRLPRVPATRSSRTVASLAPPRTLYHGGIAGLKPGDSILPVSVTGTGASNGGGLHRSDRVYATDMLETAAMFALEYSTSGLGTVYEIEPDGPLEDDPESRPWMRGYMTTSATVVRDLGLICICGSGNTVSECCGDEVVDRTRWAKFNPTLVERFSACQLLTVLPFFVPLAVDASPSAITSDIHGPAHWEQVAFNGIYLAYESAADIRVVLAFALLHDAFRESDQDDSQHGARAAEWAERNAAKLEHVDMVTLCEALRGHSTGETSTNVTIGACWDADRIDLLRVGILPAPEFMSTVAGVATAQKMTAVL